MVLDAIRLVKVNQPMVLVGAEAKGLSPAVEAVDKLLRDREALLAFYDFPAEHWQHIRSFDT